MISKPGAPWRSQGWSANTKTRSRTGESVPPQLPQRPAALSAFCGKQGGSRNGCRPSASHRTWCREEQQAQFSPSESQNHMSRQFNFHASVPGLPSPLLRCPSQRLLDRVVRRYAEVADAGSIFMDHFTDRDKLRLLYTLAVNAHPILLQIFPGAEGWPLPRYLGSCGRFLVSTSTSPLQEFYGAPADQAADLAYQLLGVLESLRSNDLNYFFYFTHVDVDMFGIFNNGHLFIRDASALGVIDRQEGSQAASRAGENKDIFSCLVSGCQTELPSCDTIPEKQSLVLVCGQVLPPLLQAKFPSPLQEEIDAELARCGEGTRPDPEVLQAASRLKDILRPLRTCDPRFAYRYPDCKYNDKF
ncbi:divergent protein kinase domain 2B isoform X2 [Pseudorca crassidens]|uniref:divergent protein kinase domain 2B isoform X2 n=1 Tax=Pseudorca crassidens TaxID=82174 RepID=UPI00352EE197